MKTKFASVGLVLVLAVGALAQRPANSLPKAGESTTMQAGNSKPNIVFILMDNLGYGEVGLVHEVDTYTTFAKLAGLFLCKPFGYKISCVDRVNTRSRMRGNRAMVAGVRTVTAGG